MKTYYIGCILDPKNNAFGEVGHLLVMNKEEVDSVKPHATEEIFILTTVMGEEIWLSDLVSIDGGNLMTGNRLY